MDDNASTPPLPNEIDRKNEQASECMRQALAHAQSTWEAAELAIAVALQAAEAAQKACQDVRNTWKGSDGEDIYNLSSAGHAIALSALWRAKDASQTGKHPDREFKRLLEKEPRLSNGSEECGQTNVGRKIRP